MNKLTIRDVDVAGKRVLVRADFNVPLSGTNGVITDDSRIQATLPTIKYLTERGARVILCSHLGRPKGKVVEKLRLTTIAQRLSQILGQKVIVANDGIGPEVDKAVAALKPGDVLLLENIRFHPQEEANDTGFAQTLARLADIYVNDAFGACHRSHASIVGIARYLPAVAGLLVEKEIEVLEGLLANPSRPFAELAGGAKVSDKIKALENTMDKVDCLLIGGGMAATFLKAKGYEVGLSLVENDKLDLATKLMQRAAERKLPLILPVDVVAAAELSAETEYNVVAVEKIPPQWRIVDIGPKTIDSFSEELRRCQTIFWNGPMGVCEIAQFARGTQAMAKLLAGLEATTIIGGGSTAEVVTELKLADKMTFVSTGGGASIRFLSGEKLPGVEALLNREG
ncbi:MAG: phosphoglycerate kinase [Dehalococcoidales bacterium]|jgi:phosphoglycerate kinase|nr:phosphoglycerate kinase [Dehalococcoidales bacterium]